MILTNQHQIPPKTYVHNGMRYATQPLIDSGPYTDWTLTSDALGPLYIRQTRALTQEEQEEQLQASRESMSITRLQARLQLLDTPDPSGQFTNAWEAVKTWAEAQGGAVLAFFEDARYWRRLDQFVLQAAPEFGWSEQDLDDLFAAAAQR